MQELKLGQAVYLYSYKLTIIGKISKITPKRFKVQIGEYKELDFVKETMRSVGGRYICKLLANSDEIKEYEENILRIRLTHDIQDVIDRLNDNRPYSFWNKEILISLSANIEELKEAIEHLKKANELITRNKKDIKSEL